MLSNLFCQREKMSRKGKRSPSSSVRKNVLLLWRFNNSQAAVCKLNKQRLLHVLLHKGAFVFCLIDCQQ